LKLSEWCNEYAYLPSIDANAGKWHNIPYQVGILDAITDPKVETITIKKSARVGYTKLLNFTIAYHIHQDPCPIMVVQPTIEDAQGYSKDDVTPMLETIPALDGLVSESKSRDKNNTILKKNFAGGSLLIVGANSARGFRRVSVRKVLFDEVDGYPPTAGQEGDQIILGKRRTDYYHNRQIIIGSTPTHKGSRIDKSFEESDQRYFYVPCPFCKHRQVLEWRNFDFSELGTIDDPVYRCDGCRKGISYNYHRSMIEQGEWLSTTPFNGHVGFHIWAAYSYSPNATWTKIVKEFIDSKKDREKLRAWTNTILGESYEEEGDRLSHDVVASRRENYTAQVPKDALFLTCSVDVQKDRLEGEVKAWGEGEEMWGIEYFILMGSTDRNDVWNQLSGKLDTIYKHESGINLEIRCTTIDSGYETDQVYKFCVQRLRHGKGVYPTKGSKTPGMPRISKPTHNNKYRVPLFNIGTDTIKTTIFARLQIENPGPGYFHFPDNYDEEYFKQLTAEEIRSSWIRGVQTRKWYKIRPRNEALDITVGNFAALEILNPNYKKIIESMNVLIEKNKNPDKNPKPKKTVRKKTGWVNSWKSEQW